MTSLLHEIGPVRAAFLVALREPLVLDDIRLPEYLEAGQVLVRVHTSGICGAQLNEMEGVKGEDKYLPHLLGHEGFGMVLEVGPGVRVVKVGDTAVLHWRKGRGIESDPPAYRWRGQRLNAGWVTTFNQYAVVSENRLTPVPADIDPEVAVLFGCAVTTGFGVVTNDARLQIGESLVVFGAGGVGLSIVQAAALTSAHPIVAVDLYDRKLELARAFGATHAVNSRRTDACTAVRTALHGRGADVIVDCTGIPAVIELAYELAGSTGRVVCVGVPRKGQNISIYSLPLHFGKVLTGSEGGGTDPSTDIPRYLRLHDAGKLRLKEMVTYRCTLDGINEAIERMRAGEIAGRCIVHLESAV